MDKNSDSLGCNCWDKIYTLDKISGRHREVLLMQQYRVEEVLVSLELRMDGQEGELGSLQALVWGMIQTSVLELVQVVVVQALLVVAA